MKKYHIVYIVSVLKNRFLAAWRRKEFEVYTGNKTENFNILGKVYVRNPNVYIGKNVTLYPGIMLQGTGNIYIGDNTYIGNNTIIYSEEGYNVSIGANCMIAGQCYIINTDHKMDKDDLMTHQGTTSANIKIEDNVWIAGNVTILKGSHIKSGCVIGAKALIRGITEKDGIYVGIPAKLLKTRR